MNGTKLERESKAKEIPEKKKMSIEDLKKLTKESFVNQDTKTRERTREILTEIDKNISDAQYYSDKDALEELRGLRSEVLDEAAKLNEKIEEGVREAVEANPELDDFEKAAEEAKQRWQEVLDYEESGKMTKEKTETARPAAKKTEIVEEELAVPSEEQQDEMAFDEKMRAADKAIEEMNKKRKSDEHFAKEMAEAEKNRKARQKRAAGLGEEQPAIESEESEHPLELKEEEPSLELKENPPEIDDDFEALKAPLTPEEEAETPPEDIEGELLKATSEGMKKRKGEEGAGADTQEIPDVKAELGAELDVPKNEAEPKQSTSESGNEVIDQLRQREYLNSSLKRLDDQKTQVLEEQNNFEDNSSRENQYESQQKRLAFLNHALKILKEQPVSREEKKLERLWAIIDESGAVRQPEFDKQLSEAAVSGDYKKMMEAIKNQIAFIEKSAIEKPRPKNLEIKVKPKSSGPGRLSKAAGSLRQAVLPDAESDWTNVEPKAEHQPKSIGERLEKLWNWIWKG